MDTTIVYKIDTIIKVDTQLIIDTVCVLAKDALKVNRQINLIDYFQIGVPIITVLLMLFALIHSARNSRAAQESAKAAQKSVSLSEKAERENLIIRQLLQKPILNAHRHYDYVLQDFLGIEIVNQGLGPARITNFKIKVVNRDYNASDLSENYLNDIYNQLANRPSGFNNITYFPHTMAIDGSGYAYYNTTSRELYSFVTTTEPYFPVKVILNEAYKILTIPDQKVIGDEIMNFLKELKFKISYQSIFEDNWETWETDWI